jgi:hypothetical protein
MQNRIQVFAKMGFADIEKYVSYVNVHSTEFKLGVRASDSSPPSFDARLTPPAIPGPRWLLSGLFYSYEKG